MTRRRLLAGGLGARAAAVLAACEVPKVGGGATPTGATETPAGDATTTPDNDGSWQDTGPPPNQPKPAPLAAGGTPPQLVVISWDGAGETPRLPLLSHFVPEEKRTLYHPPGRKPGASAIPFMNDEAVHATIDNIGKAWSEGHETPNGDPAKRPTWQRDATNTYLAGFTRAYEGNRAPLIIGNHFEDWNGGIYMKTVEDAMRTMATYPDTRFVSFRQLCDYLDAQPPATLAKLRKLPIGAAPTKGWATYLVDEG